MTTRPTGPLEGFEHLRSWKSGLSRHPSVRAYLRQSSLGLWGNRRKLVQAELLGHIGARVHDLSVTRTDIEAAIKQTLAELGAPGLVSHGMIRLYTLPGIFVLLSVALVLGSLMLNRENAIQDIRILTMDELAICGAQDKRLSIRNRPGGLDLVSDRCLVDRGETWIAMRSLPVLFGGSSATWREVSGGAELQFPGASPVLLNRAPPQGLDSWTPAEDAPADVAARPLKGPVIDANGQQYISSSTVLQEIVVQSGSTVKLDVSTPHDMPRLIVGDTWLALPGFTDEALKGLFANYLMRRLMSDSKHDRASWDLHLSSRAREEFRHEISAYGEGGDKSPSFFAVAYISTSGTLRLDVLRPGEEGSLVFYLPWEDPVWVDNALDLTIDQAALVVRITGILSDAPSLYEPLPIVQGRP